MMTAGIGDDGIDPSHFLPKNTSIINRFRDAKGYMDGVVETRTVEGEKVKVITTLTSRTSRSAPIWSAVGSWRTTIAGTASRSSSSKTPSEPPATPSQRGLP